MPTKIKFTKTALDKLSCPSGKNDVVFHDEALPGLQLRVWASGKKVFTVRCKLDGKAKRVSLGQYPAMTIEQARAKARQELAHIFDGIDPNALKKADRAKKITVGQCLEDYLSTRSNLKESTATTYRNALNQHVPSWMNKPLLWVTRDRIEAKHKEIGSKSPTSANKVMRILRALFEYAHGKYEDERGEPLILHNPVKRLSQAKVWFKESRRSTFIKAGDLKPWYEAVSTTPEWLASRDPEGLRDYLLLVLFTGLRRREASSLTWDSIDIEHATLNIIDTKNGHPHTLPLPSSLLDMLKRRRAITKGQPYVFPSSSGKGCLAEPKKGIAKVRDKSGIYFTLHDLRRTFITVAESLGIRDYTLKRLLNHRSSGDVTDGYIVTDVERLREPMQMIEDRLLLLATKPGNVVALSVNAKSA